MKRLIKSTLAKVKYAAMRPLLGRPLSEDLVDIYGSQMLIKFNKLHGLIFPRFFSKMRVDQDSLNEAKRIIGNAVPIYVTTHIGQIEYNYFNYLFLKDGLPLAAYANGLSNRLWMPLKMAMTSKITELKKKAQGQGILPNPVSSGHVERLLNADEKSVFIRLRTTRIHDDLYWEDPAEDIVQKIIKVQRKQHTPFYILPLQFLWAKRPERENRSIIDWLFGERENPGSIRKIILFWRNYKNHAIVQFCEPFSLKDFTDAHPALDDEEMARILKSALIRQISQERKRITGPALKPRRWMMEQVVESEAVQKQVYAIAGEKGKDVEDLKIIARKYASEMAADVGYTYIEYGNRILNWIFNSMYDGIQYNREALSEIKKIVQKYPIVLVPNHRSHIDYLLISNLLYGNDIAVPHVAAGINLSFWPIGNIFRHCGAFFIRRTFSGNPLYKAVFESYIRLLIKEGYCQEFFIEGGRSRTGKLRQPMLGMISSIIQAMLDGAANDLYFVPAAITYDKVVEEAVYLNEVAGEEKKKERLRDILKLTKYLKRRYGKIYVNFGKPISFNKISLEASGAVDKESRKRAIVEKTAFEIMDSLNRNSIVTPQGLVAAAFLMEEKRGVTSSRLAHNIELLQTYLQFTETKMSDTLISDAARSIQDAIKQLSTHKTIEPHDDFDPVYYSLPEEKRSQLDFQKNSIIHFLLPISYAAASFLALLKRGRRGSVSIDDLNEKIDFLKKLFTMEFAAHDGIVNGMAIEQAIKFLLKRELIIVNEENRRITITAPATDIFRSYASLIQNLLDSYKTAFYTCSKIAPADSIGEKALARKMQDNGKHLILLGQITRPESISKPVYESAIKLFKLLGFLLEELTDSESKEKISYRWNRASPALQEFQQQLELFY